jgi:hypothetical protein
VGKLIVMSTNPLPSGDIPVTPNDLRNVAVTIDIFRSLAGIPVLEATTRLHGEKIEKLTEQVSAIPYFRKEIAQNRNGLNQLERQVNGLGERLTRENNEQDQRLSQQTNDKEEGLDERIKKLENVSYLVRALGAVLLVLLGWAVGHFWH